MIFSLEALRAKYGDSLLLHYGAAEDPRLVVIDGGPSGVFKATLLPRLEQLRGERGGKLPIEVLMVSHLDDDHVRGVLDLAEAMDEEGDLRAGFDVKTLWVNAFEDTVGDAKPITAAVAAAPAGLESHLEAVVASVGEGRDLRDVARKLHWPVNDGFDQLVMAPDDAGVDIDLDPLRLTVVGPRATELEELRKKWAKEVAKLAKAKPAEAARIAEYLDQSVYNLSSIVCLAQVGSGSHRKRMLLTGDARGDKILLGLEAAGLLKPAPSDPLEIDLLKMPHHGSSRNLEPEFFERVKAKAMVISANGKFHNPDVETLEMISAARPDDDFTIYLTYPYADFELGMGPKIEAFFEKEARDGRKYEVVSRPDDALSLRVDLLDPPA
jgi:beta-lactamase superfamily II metal-dependent hydrolase